MNIEKAREFLEDVLEHADLPPGILSGTTLLKIEKAFRELQPYPRVIDWQKVVDQQLPVMVSNRVESWFSFLTEYKSGEAVPFRAGRVWVSNVSLETGQWVFNASGENPWPGGVLIEVWLKNGAIWDLGQELSILKWKHDILASRAVGLEPDWSYGGGE